MTSTAAGGEGAAPPSRGSGGGGAKPPMATFASDLHPRGTPINYTAADGASSYRRHVVEEDSVAQDYSSSRRAKIARAPLSKLYVDAIEVGGDYQEIPLTAQEQYGVVQKGAAIVKALAFQEARAAAAAAPPANDTDEPKISVRPSAVGIEAGGGLASEASGLARETGLASEASMTSGLARETMANPLHELPVPFWEAIRHIAMVDQAYKAFLPEIRVLAAEREYRPLEDYLVEIGCAGLSVHKIQRVCLRSARPNLLHVETAFHSKRDPGEENEDDDAGSAGSEEISIAELPTVVEERLRLHLLLKPQRERMWPPTDEAAKTFEGALESTFEHERTAFLYCFVCYFFKLK